MLHAPTRAKRGRLESDKHNLVRNALKTSVSFREGYCCTTYCMYLLYSVDGKTNKNTHTKGNGETRRLDKRDEKEGKTVLLHPQGSSFGQITIVPSIPTTNGLHQRLKHTR